MEMENEKLLNKIHEFENANNDSSITNKSFIGSCFVSFKREETVI